MTKTFAQLKRTTRAHRDIEKAEFLKRFFKTGKGEYAEGDKFYGIVVPTCRKIAKHYQSLSMVDLDACIKSQIHEERLIALVILENKVKAGELTLDDAAAFYEKHLQYINNWDLVDISAHKILGPYYFNRSHKKLIKMAHSKHLWTRRVAVLTCFYFIKQRKFDTIREICEILLHDQHDLMHKATGWMLREMGKQDVDALRSFLKQHGGAMPRTMLRYAIEKLPEKERKQWLASTKV